ncbi:PIG-L family deacetylase [bacterium]|nr:PIG-L family deacetylase [bacterium]
MKTGMRIIMTFTALLILAQGYAPAADRQLRIICFGAHPDDAEIEAGGVAALWSGLGHAVKFVSVTNGDIGHWREAGGPLALRRKAEVEAVAEILGNTVEVLDIHDGELEPTLENRRIITRLIREWKADIVMTHRPNDYHPDHRYTGVLVQDAAFMVSVPFFCPDTPALPWNPVFLYYPDHFQKPEPFHADIAVSIDAVIKKKIDALAGMDSQFYEGGALGSADLIPSDPQLVQARREKVRLRFENQFKDYADRFRDVLSGFYGKEADGIRYAEAFEICEYGRRPDKAEILKLFPFINP